MKKILYIFIIITMLFIPLGCKTTDEILDDASVIEPKTTKSPAAQKKTQTTKDLSDEEIDKEIDLLINKMTIQDKAGQMIQGARYAVTQSDVKKYGLGSVLSGGGDTQTDRAWRVTVEGYQKAALSREISIPIIYGVDAVHGHDHMGDAVIFPHNIGLGATDDMNLVKEMGQLVAMDIKYSGIHWNFGPCVACAYDPRWGRTYESYSTDAQITSDIASAYLEGQQSVGILGCVKHYIADGGTTYNTGQYSILDRGDVVMSEDALREKFLLPYQTLVDQGVMTVMASFSMFNGTPMHEHSYLINDVLKDELGFTGFVISDWEGHHYTSPNEYQDKVAVCINAGVDMLMEPERWKEGIEAIQTGVENGKISIERVDDAVRRILWVKYKLGLFDEQSIDIDYTRLRESQVDLATKLVEKSAVLVKNENDVLPLQPGIKALVIGPASNNVGVQCGGWTTSWQGEVDKSSKLRMGTTLTEALGAISKRKNIEILTDEQKINEADVVILAIGEIPYAEYKGDSEDISITGQLALKGNIEAIEFAKETGKPIITVIIAGRNVIITDYMDDWDSIVIAYLPGTQAEGLANLISGDAKFTGKLPMPWYLSVDEIGKQSPELLYEMGFGMCN